MLKVKAKGARDIAHRAASCYFRRVEAHVCVGDPACEPRRDTASFFVTFEDDACMIRVSRTVEVDGICPVDLGCFYDGYAMLDQQVRHDPDGRWVRIMGRCGRHEDCPARTIGLYNPDTHTLVATDWVHASYYAGAVDRIAQAMGWTRHEIVESDPTEHAFLLGADPEWEAWDPETGRVIRPPVVEIDDEDGQVGLDGSGLVVEARPLPAPDPEMLYIRIRALARAWEEQTGLRACLAGHVQAAGCHVHIGAPPGYALEGPYDTYIRALDARVGRVLALSGEARDYYRRRAAWRHQPHGVEYRTPPSGILADPDLAVFVFWAALKVARGEAVTWPRPLLARYRELRELIRRRVPFTFGPRELRPEPPRPALILHAQDHWSEGWYEWRELARHRMRQAVMLFGFSSGRGRVTNHPGLAEALGWGLVDFVPPAHWPRAEIYIGLPYVARELFDARVADALLAVLIQEGAIQP